MGNMIEMFVSPVRIWITDRFKLALFLLILYLFMCFSLEKVFYFLKWTFMSFNSYTQESTVFLLLDFVSLAIWTGSDEILLSGRQQSPHHSDTISQTL